MTQPTPVQFPANDNQFEDRSIATVEQAGEGWSISRDDGWSFFVPKESPVVPAVGMRARFYGKGIGYTVRGLFIDGQQVFYHTEAEQDAWHKRKSEESDQRKRYDAEQKRGETANRIAALPHVFQQRIADFRRRNADFWWEFESYELFVCEQAVAIAKAIGPDLRDLNEFRRMPWEQQLKVVPTLSDGHSGNTFGASCQLAARFIMHPELVPKEHGALCPLVGCKEYGCYSTETTP